MYCESVSIICEARTVRPVHPRPTLHPRLWSKRRQTRCYFRAQLTSTFLRPFTPQDFMAAVFSSDVRVSQLLKSISVEAIVGASTAPAPGESFVAGRAAN